MFHVEQIFPREEEKRVAKIVAIANQKGGVGKTTTAVNLSSCVAALGKKVLIVDLDPQGNTTTGYGIPKRSVEAGTYEVLIGKATAAEAIRHTEYRTDVIGSNTRLAGASLEMIDLPGREGRLRKALAEVQKDYDFIFIDCPPSLVFAKAKVNNNRICTEPYAFLNSGNGILLSLNLAASGNQRNIVNVLQFIFHITRYRVML